MRTKEVKKIIKWATICGTVSLGILYIVWDLLKRAYDFGCSDTLKDVNYIDGIIDKAAFDTGFYTRNEEKFSDFEKACIDMGLEIGH